MPRLLALEGRGQSDANPGPPQQLLQVRPEGPPSTPGGWIAERGPRQRGFRGHRLGRNRDPAFGGRNFFAVR